MPIDVAICCACTQVFPKCGDGVQFAVTLTPIDGSEVQILHEVRFAKVWLAQPAAMLSRHPSSS